MNSAMMKLKLLRVAKLLTKKSDGRKLGRVLAVKLFDLGRDSSQNKTKVHFLTFEKVRLRNTISRAVIIVVSRSS